jgi:hypothetical protein
MVKPIACVLPQAQRWMQSAESGLDRELPVVRRAQHLKDLRRLPTAHSFRLFRSFVPEPKKPIPEKEPDPTQKTQLRSAAIKLPNYQITHLPNRLIPISKGLTRFVPIDAAYVFALCHLPSANCQMLHFPIARSPDGTPPRSFPNI